MDEKEILRQYQEQMTSRLQDEPEQNTPTDNATWGSTTQSGTPVANPIPDPNLDLSLLDKIKAVITDKKNRLYVIIGAFVFTLVLLALIAPVIAPLFQPKDPEATPEPTYVPVPVDDKPMSFQFDSEINQDYAKLEQDIKEVEIVDLEMSFPQTDWEVEF